MDDSFDYTSIVHVEGFSAPVTMDDHYTMAFVQMVLLLLLFCTVLVIFFIVGLAESSRENCPVFLRMF